MIISYPYSGHPQGIGHSTHSACEEKEAEHKGLKADKNKEQEYYCEEEIERIEGGEGKGKGTL